MKLKAVPSLWNQKMAISDGSLIEFNNQGICDVKDSVGKEMLEKYPSMVFEENYEKKPAKTPEQEFTQGYAQQLQRELEAAKEEAKQRKEEVESVTADKNAWAEKVAEVVLAKAKAEKDLEDYKATYEKQTKFYELKIELINSTAENLRTMCSKAEFVKEEWEKLSKEKLVDYILNKSE